MSAISLEFHQFIKNIETGFIVKVYLKFKNIEDLRQSAAYYFQRGVQNQHLAAKFASSALIFSVAAPPNEKVNFREAVTKECLKQIDLICNCLSSASSITLNKAMGTFRFFGELFVVGFITKQVLKKYMEILRASKHECSISYHCYYYLIAIVKEKIKSEDEVHSIVHRELINIIDSAETPTDQPHVIRAPNASSSEVFPPLSKINKVSVTVDDKVRESIKIGEFKAKINKLTQTNDSILLKEIIDSHLMCYEEGKWQKYYEILIDKALKEPEVAESVTKMCIKIAKSKNDVWQEIKPADYKKYIQHNVITSLEKLFDAERNEGRVFPIVNFIQKLADNSLISIGSISAFINTIIDGAEKDNYLASKTLVQLVVFIKPQFNTDKIKKLPEDKRKKVVEIIMKGRHALSPKLSSKIDDITRYLTDDAEYVAQDDSEASSSNSFSESGRSSQFSAINENEMANHQDEFINESRGNMEHRHSLQSTSSDQRSTSSQIYMPNPGLFIDPAWIESRIGTNIVVPAFPTVYIQKVQFHAAQPPPNQHKFVLIERAMQMIDFSQLDSTAMKLRSINITTVKELDFLAECFIRLVRMASDPSFVPHFSKLAQMMDNLTVSTDREVIAFHQVLLNKFEHDFLDFFNPSLDQLKSDEIKNMTAFIAELYILEIASHEVIKLCMDVLFRHETHCMNSVYCIEIMIQSIGPKLKERDETMFDDYFQFFNGIIASNEKHHRSTVYKNLVKLRANNWMLCVKPSILQHVVATKSDTKDMDENETDKEAEKKIECKKEKEETQNLLVLTEETLKNPEELNAFIRTQKIQLTTPSMIKNFIAKMLLRSLTDWEFIKPCVDIFKQLIGVSEFKEILTERLMIYCVKSSSKDTLKEEAVDSLSNLFIMFGELYRKDIFTDDNLAHWTFHKHLRKIPVQTLSYVSSIITPKIQMNGNNHVEQLLTTLEVLIHTLTMNVFSVMKNDLDDLSNLVTELLDIKSLKM